MIKIGRWTYNFVGWDALFVNEIHSLNSVLHENPTKIRYPKLLLLLLKQLLTHQKQYANKSDGFPKNLYRLNLVKGNISFEFYWNVQWNMFLCLNKVSNKKLEHTKNELLHDKRIWRLRNQNSVHLTMISICSGVVREKERGRTFLLTTTNMQNQRECSAPKIRSILARL